MVQAIQEWSDEILAVIDKFQHKKQKKSKEVVDSTSEANLQIVEGKSEVEVQERKCQIWRH